MATYSAQEAENRIDDADGNLFRSHDGRNIETHYEYDSRSRQTASIAAATLSTETRTETDYDAASQLSQLTYPDGTEVDRTYTDRGQLHTLDFDSTTIDTRSHDDGGRMAGSVYRNGVSETRAYNTDNTLASISYSGAAIGSYSYGWDDNKNKTSETITGTMSNDGFTVPTSGYDDEDRLVGWERADSNLDQSWNLSLVGDWDSFTENSTTQNRTHGNAHEILTADSQSVTHDAKGNQTGLPSNLTTSTSGLTLEWDFENKLHAADLDGTSGADILQKFDALGRRISRDDGTTNAIFVPSGQQTIADYTAGTAASSPTYRYVYASYIDEPVMRSGSMSTAKLYYHRNQQYSVTALTDTTGTISERYAYDAYAKLSVFDGSGTVLSSSAYGNRYTYTGREWDEKLGLYHYRARMYSPESGRFASRDPIRFEGSKWNLFEYVNSRPVAGTDPMGLTEFHDDFGRWCCNGEDCDVQIGVRAPCRSVAAQIADNLKHSLPPMKGVVSGHAWMEGRCGNRWFNTGIYTNGPNPFNGPILFQNEGPRVKRYGFTHRLRFKACPESFGKIWSSIVEMREAVAAGGEDAPRYCAIDPLNGGNVNCATWVRDVFEDSGLIFEKWINEPINFTSVPGVVLGNKKCLEDLAGR